MYDEFETRTSFKYLKEVIENLNDPICILGGWAVFFHVNKNFQKAQGRTYLGSRDIDLGFQTSNSALKDTIKVLTKLRFKPHSFRFLKEVHTETEEEIGDSEIIPSHFIFPMYVDLIVDKIPENFRNKYGFDPIDEPLLKKVFYKKEYVIVKEFGKTLLLPDVEPMIAMKINSLPDRDKTHKRIKDICDLFALAWYANKNLNEINVNLPSDKLKKCMDTITEADLKDAGKQLEHSADEIKRVIESVCGRQ